MENKGKKRRERKKKNLKPTKIFWKERKSIKITIDKQNPFSFCHTLFQNEPKSAEFIKAESALLLRPPEHCESNRWETKEECNELAGKV